MVDAAGLIREAFEKLLGRHGVRFKTKSTSSHRTPFTPFNETDEDLRTSYLSFSTFLQLALGDLWNLVFVIKTQSHVQLTCPKVSFHQRDVVLHAHSIFPE
jgi:hypothetical protein